MTRLCWHGLSSSYQDNHVYVHGSGISNQSVDNSHEYCQQMYSGNTYAFQQSTLRFETTGQSGTTEWLMAVKMRDRMIVGLTTWPTEVKTLVWDTQQNEEPRHEQEHVELQTRW